MIVVVYTIEEEIPHLISLEIDPGGLVLLGLP